MPSEREAVVGRWLELTRHVLPGMATAQGWPIQLDHCFMRVFLDAAFGGRWDRQVRRPAIRHVDIVRLRRAIDVAEQVVARPQLLSALNRQSLAWRRLTTDAARAT